MAASANTAEQYASSIFKATVKYVNKFGDGVTKMFVKLVLPKVNAFSDENSFDTGKKIAKKKLVNRNLTNDFELHVSELNMYVNTLPDMQRLLSQGGEKIELAPR